MDTTVEAGEVRCEVGTWSDAPPPRVEVQWCVVVDGALVPPPRPRPAMLDHNGAPLEACAV